VFDPEEYRTRSIESWDEAASGWADNADAFQVATMPVSVAMVDAVDPQPGQTIVELAAGLGDTGFLAVQRAQPGGRLLCTDGSQEMLDAARARATALGLGDAEVQFRLMQAEWLDLSAATVDAILCRWGYMLLADPEAALRETRRVLRPDGRLALAAWAGPEHNPWMSTVGRVLVARDLTPPPDPGVPGPFSFAADGVIDELLGGVGLQDIVVESVDFTFTAPDLDAWWEMLSARSLNLRTVVAGLDPAAHYELRDAVDAAHAAFVEPDGRVVLPARTWVAAATA
jgi:SAM-dependent methyltransferase